MEKLALREEPITGVMAAEIGLVMAVVEVVAEEVIAVVEEADEEAEEEVTWIQDRCLAQMEMTHARQDQFLMVEKVVAVEVAAAVEEVAEVAEEVAEVVEVEMDRLWHK